MSSAFEEMSATDTRFARQDNQSLDGLCDTAAHVFSADVAALVLMQNGVSRMIASYGIDDRFRSRVWAEETPFGAEQQVVVLDSGTSPAIQNKLAFLGLDQSGFFLRTPVITAPDHVLSLIIFTPGTPEKPTAKKPTARQMRLLEDLKPLIAQGFGLFMHLLTDPLADVTAAINLNEVCAAARKSATPAVVLDQNLTVVAANDDMARLLDIPLSRLVGMSHLDVAVPMTNAITALYRHALTTHVSPPDFEVVRDDDAGRAVYRVTISPFSPIETRDYFLYVTARDVTELHARENQLSKRIGKSAQKPEPSLDFLCETLVERRSIRARKTVNYITLRAWRASIRDWQIKALRALKGHLPPAMPDVIAGEILTEISALVGVSAFRAVVPIPCGHTREGPCLSLEIARALAGKIGIPVVQAFVTRPMKGTSHPKENVKRPPLVLTRPLDGPVLLVDDVATSGSHIEEAVKLLRPHCGSVLAVAWIGGDSA